MTTVQLDLFAPTTDTRRLVDGLTCLRDTVPEALEVITDLAYRLTEDTRTIGACGDWAYSVRRAGLRFEHVADWWHGAANRGELFGWARTPAHLITWQELTAEVGADPRRTDLIAWSRSLVEPAWQQRRRPYELDPKPGQFHPDRIPSDHEHPGWAERITAWRTLQAILTDAISRLDPCWVIA